MKTFGLLLVLAALALWYFDASRKLSQDTVRAAYDEHIEAFHKGQPELLCLRMTPDYRIVDVTVGQDGTVRSEMGRDEACRKTHEAIAIFGRLGALSGGSLVPEIDVEIQSIELSPDRKSATVQSVSTMRMAGRPVMRTRAIDHLIRRTGRVLSRGGESRTWAYLPQ
ncbi:hypothetical protein [Montanilutibacter psychrotolerans]|uniref:Nuclear transport factor 2 family protein n=1 Tax=Montanilutibacter psychrotolerans TaxID=1327343 RepID=A0A3M8T131_9GAMM|nr:hypothetical protein [Lysobacter psychrotolerans]RNF85376.1 hypothetical protein EER27_06335 [Lysobacter psychrotolerans]